LRGVSLVGIDSVMAPIAKRERAWERLSKDLDMEKLSKMVVETTLDEIINFGQSIIDGQVRGRVVVNIAK
jgi:acrylyl-CoA reductase (NADPH)